MDNNLNIIQFIKKKPLVDAIRVGVVYLTIIIEVKQLSFVGSLSIFDFCYELFPLSLMSSVVFLGVLLADKLNFFSNTLADKIASAIFSGFMVIGISLEREGSFFVLFNSFAAVLIATVIYIGYYYIFIFAFGILRKIYSFLIRLDSSKITIIDRFSKLRLFLVLWGTILLFWLPWVLLRFPGAIEGDEFEQIEQFLGYLPLHAHFPVALTVLYGGCVKLGRFIFGSDGMGLFLCSVLQMIVCSAVLAYSLMLVKKKHISNAVLTGMFILYCVVPIFAGVCTTIVKDVLYSAMVLLAMLLVFDVVMLGRNVRIIPMFMAFLLICLFRNNGIFIIAAWFLGFLVYVVHNKNKLLVRCVLLPLGVTILVYTVFIRALLPLLNIPQDRNQETFSVIYQQTARYLKEYPTDVSEEEYNVINSVLDAESIKENYNPLLSDPVKRTFHGTDETLKNYFIVWMKMFLRHPDVYFDATLHNSYGFFYPNARWASKSPYGTKWEDRSDEFVQFNYPKLILRLSNYIKGYGLLWERLPFISLINTTSIYVWIFIWCVIDSVIKKKKEMLLLFIPGIVSLLVCIVSPTWWWNGFRYAYPIVVSSPFLLVQCAKNENKNDIRDYLE